MLVVGNSRQYCRYTKSPWVTTLLKEIWESLRTKENLAPVGFEPTTSGTDLPVLYRLSYKASTGAGRGNLASEFAVSIQMKGIYSSNFLWSVGTPKFPWCIDIGSIAYYRHLNINLNSIISISRVLRG